MFKSLHYIIFFLFFIYVLKNFFINIFLIFLTMLNIVLKKLNEYLIVNILLNESKTNEQIRLKAFSYNDIYSEEFFNIIHKIISQLDSKIIKKPRKKFNLQFLTMKTKIKK